MDIAYSIWNTGIISLDSLIAFQEALISLLIPVAIAIFETSSDIKPKWIFKAMLRECIHPPLLASCALLPLVILSIGWNAFPGICLLMICVLDTIFVLIVMRTFLWFVSAHWSKDQYQSYYSKALSSYINRLVSKPDQNYPELLYMWDSTWNELCSDSLQRSQPMLTQQFRSTVGAFTDDRKIALAATICSSLSSNKLNLLDDKVLRNILFTSFDLIAAESDMGYTILNLTIDGLNKSHAEHLTHKHANNYIKQTAPHNGTVLRIAYAITLKELSLIKDDKRSSAPSREWGKIAVSDHIGNKIDKNIFASIRSGYLKATRDSIFNLIDKFRRAAENSDITEQYKASDAIDHIASAALQTSFDSRTLGDILTVARPPVFISIDNSNENSFCSKFKEWYKKFRGTYLKLTAPVSIVIDVNSTAEANTNQLHNTWKKTMDEQHQLDVDNAVYILSQMNLSIDIGFAKELVDSIADDCDIELSNLKNSLTAYLDLTKHAGEIGCNNTIA